MSSHRRNVVSTRNPRILMVCLGNVCRSPSAEAILRAKLAAAGIAAEIDSAGTGAPKAHPVHPESATLLTAHGYPCDELRSRQVTPHDLDEFDWVLAMDRDVLRDLERLGPARGQVELFLQRVESARRRDVPDPMINGRFDRVFELIEEACDAWVEIFSQRAMQAG